jgi:hypothetical protein
VAIGCSRRDSEHGLESKRGAARSGTAQVFGPECQCVPQKNSAATRDQASLPEFLIGFPDFYAMDNRRTKR